MFSEAIKRALREHVRRVKALQQRDLSRGLGAAPMPEAFNRKVPSASLEFAWQYVFPAFTTCVDPRTGGVLALVSTPGFDANLFVNGISSGDYAALRDSLSMMSSQMRPARNRRAESSPEQEPRPHVSWG